MRLIILILFFVTSFAHPLYANNMFEDYKWNNRLIFVFTPSKADADYKNQISIFHENIDVLTDRDVVTFIITDQNIVDIEGNIIGESNTELIEKYKINQQFTVILIGKDGFEKLRKLEPLSIETLKNTIDAMPMRKREMNK